MQQCPVWTCSVSWCFRPGSSDRVCILLCPVWISFDRKRWGQVERELLRHLIKFTPGMTPGMPCLSVRSRLSPSEPDAYTGHTKSPTAGLDFGGLCQAMIETSNANIFLDICSNDLIPGFTSSSNAWLCHRAIFMSRTYTTLVLEPCLHHLSFTRRPQGQCLAKTS